MLKRLVAVLVAPCLIGAVGVAPVAAKPKPKPAAAGPAALPTPSAADWRTPDPQNVLVIDTNKGRIIVEMYPQIAPNHVVQVRALAHDKFYDGQSFFRVVDGFMDQTGDPTNTGAGGSKLPNLKAEFSFRRGADAPFVMAHTVEGGEVGFVGAAPVWSQSSDLMALTADGKVSGYGFFCAGTTGMARAGDPDSANSQFYLMRDNYESLNRKYTVWGRVIVGQDVVRAIKTGEPVDPPQDQMTSVRLLADLPEGQRPKISVIDTQGAYFKAALAAEAASKGADFSVCDVAIPAKVQ
jgi:peptidylprolyl isomerase